MAERQEVTEGMQSLDLECRLRPPRKETTDPEVQRITVAINLNFIVNHQICEISTQPQQLQSRAGKGKQNIQAENNLERREMRAAPTLLFLFSKN